MTQTGSDKDAIVRPLLLKAEELGQLLGVSRGTIWSWHSSGKIPLPVRIGGATRWRRDEILAWVEAGAPPREKWIAIREKGRRGGP
ncbi:MAG: helix-turn-helix domain-containing protein [Planctomycetota bacterium]